MAFVRNPVVYVPDLTNGRPIVDGKVYLLTAGTVPPTQDSAINPADLLTVTYVNEAGNTVTQPQPLYTSKGGCLYGSFPEEARQYMIAPQEYVFAAYDKIGRLQYSAETTASDYVETDALAAVDSTVLVGGVEAGDLAKQMSGWKNAKQYGAVGDGVTDDWSSLQTLINSGGRIFIPEGTYLISKPLIIPSFVEVRGVSRNTIILKTSADTTGAPVNCVIATEINANNFSIRYIEARGNRTDFSSGNVATVSGFYLNQAAYFELEGLRAYKCLTGFIIHASYIGTISRCLATRCSGYAFRTQSGCTTLTFQSLTAWGTGGGYDINGTIYSNFVSCAADLCDYGGKPGDPFLPEGSGGSYTSPNFIWRVIASKVNIYSSGCENNASRWLYAEGAFVNFDNPYAFNLECYATSYQAIHIAGTGRCEVNIRVPDFDFKNTLTANATRRAVLVDNPNNKKLRFDKWVEFSDAWGLDQKYMSLQQFDYDRGTFFQNSKPVFVADQNNLINGQSFPFITDVAVIEGIAETIAGVKKLRIANKTTSPQAIELPITRSGSVRIRAFYNQSIPSGVLPTIRVVDGSGSVLGSAITLSGTSGFVNQAIRLDQDSAAASGQVKLQITVRSSTDTLRFDYLLIERID